METLIIDLQTIHTYFQSQKAMSSTPKEKDRFNDLQSSIQETIKIIKAVREYRDAKNFLGL